MKKSASNLEWENHYETAIHVLKQIRYDYHYAMKELQDVSSHIGDRQTATSKQLSVVLDVLQYLKDQKGEYSSTTALLAPSNQELIDNRYISSLNKSQPILTLEVYCLGAFQTRVGLEMIERWHSIKAKSLLKFLISRQRKPILKEVLMEALWPGCEPQLANNNLKAAVRALRQTLNIPHDVSQDFGWVLFHDGNYMINSQAKVWVDTEQFESHWNLGWKLEKEGRFRPLGMQISIDETSCTLCYKERRQ